MVVRRSLMCRMLMRCGFRLLCLLFSESCSLVDCRVYLFVILRASG